MRRILADFVAYGRQYMRSRIGAFFAFAFPLILILLFGAIFSGEGATNIPLHVQDLDGSDASRRFLALLNETNVTEYHAIPPDQDIRDYISANSIDTALRIPSDFEEQVERASAGDPTATVNVTVYGDPTQSTYGIALSAVSAAATGMNFEIAGARPVIFPEPQTIAREEFKFIDFFLPGIIGFNVLANALFAMAPTAAEYRTRKYFKFLGTTTLTKGEWLASKVLFYTVIMTISALIMYTVSTLVFGGRTTLTPLTFAFIAAGCLEFTALGMVFGLYAKDVESASAVANAVGFPMMFLSGTFFPLEAMPAFLRQVAAFLPLTYLNEGLRATMILGNNAVALVNLAITVGLGAAIFLVPALVLTWKSK